MARKPPSRSSAATTDALISHERFTACASAVGVAVVQRRDVRFDPVEEFAVGNCAGLDHFRDTRGEFARRQRLQRADIGDHRLRLIKRADHVLAERMIDAGLAAHRRIDLREQRGRHLDERHAAHVAGGGKTRHVADHAAAQRNQRGLAVGALGRAAR